MPATVGSAVLSRRWRGSHLPWLLAAAAVAFLAYALFSSGGEAQAQSECVKSLGAISGTQTISGQSSSGCLSTRPTRAGSGDRYARFYTFTLSGSSAVTIKLTSAASGDSDGENLDLYQYVLNGHGSSGSVAAENDNITPRTNFNSRVATTLGAGSYTVEATSHKIAQSGSLTLIIESPEVFTPTSSPTPTPTATVPPTCNVQSMGTLSGSATRGGSWGSDCSSAHRSGKYARYYNFRVSGSSEVTIKLTSATDTNVFLLLGSGKGGRVIEESDDIETYVNLNSRIVRTLGAGTYTVEATTYADAATGSFTLRVQVSGTAPTATHTPTYTPTATPTRTPNATPTSATTTGTASLSPDPSDPGSVVFRNVGTQWHRFTVHSSSGSVKVIANPGTTPATWR